MSRRIAQFFLAIIPFLPAFSQSREVLVYEDSVNIQVVGALDFLENAYEDNPVLDYISKYTPPVQATEAGVLDMIIGAFSHSDDLFHHAITSGFGYRDEFERMHWGVDVRMKSGEGISAPLSGTVARTGYDRNGYGRFVIIEHPDGLQTRYAHLRDILVQPGQEIEAGTIIGTCGSTGNSTAPHLHFEVRRNGFPINPTHIFTFSQE